MTARRKNDWSGRGAQKGTYIPRTVDSESGFVEPAGYREPVEHAEYQPDLSRLHRSSVDRWFGGVCGGLAESFDWNPTLVRLLFVLSVMLPGPQVIFYVAAWILMPKL